ncbi:competence protein ComFB [Sporosarcina sp. PTS2304]|uniref:late competence development ComFB family protein n=1 Tax=Sporosarcina sp. PTS2304 TaxID=2283194 RepID=UPI000E0DADD5|nr:late competence development ComFB family protein [Sporosarcina sp. PTS2304]AXH98407.1 competence protein ComFB [Sporosarcina sp. PTS2304]
MKVHNIMEVVVVDVLKKYKDQLHMPCTCEQCMNDVLAMTLNHLKPQYIVKDSNSAYVRALHEADRQGSTAILTKVAWAARVVAENPRCDKLRGPSE